jgi:hypothetical protein
VDPDWDQVESPSFYRIRIGIGIQGMPIRIRLVQIGISFKQMVSNLPPLTVIFNVCLCSLKIHKHEIRIQEGKNDPQK